MKEGTGEGCVNIDLDGDGQITEGKTVYLWYGEDKTNNTRPVDGVKCYVSTDLYNWTDKGTVLYLQSSILPIEESAEKAITSSAGANGTGTTQSYPAMQLSNTNFETLKAWGKLSAAPEGVTEAEFRDVKLFLRAYVTEFEKEPTSAEDISWIAKSYDETKVEQVASCTLTARPMEPRPYPDYSLLSRECMVIIALLSDLRWSIMKRQRNLSLFSMQMDLCTTMKSCTTG